MDRPNFVPGSGNPHAKLLVLGEAPGREEDTQKIPFVGSSGQFLWGIFSELGIDRSEVWATNVFKYRPPNNNIKRIGEVCRPEEEIAKLWREINEINPNCILCLGNTAFQTIRGHGGITKWRGSILKSKYGDKKLIGTIHPSNVVRTSEYEGHKPWPYIWKFIMKIDIKRAIEQSKFSSYEVPQRIVTICRDSVQLSNFLSRNKHRKKMAEDIESFNCIPICTGISFDKYEAMVVPLFNKIGPLNIGGIPTSDQSFIWQMIDNIQREKDLVGQNFKYDQEKMESIGFRFNRGIGPSYRPVYSDTLLKCHTIIPELPSKKMEMQQSIWTELPYHKDEGKMFNPRRDKIDRLFHYCGLDVLSTFETDGAMEEDLDELGLRSFYYDYVMELHEIYKDMETVGFAQDKDANELLKVKYQTQHDLIQARIKDAVPDFEVSGKKCHKGHLVNVAAPDQIKTLLYKYLKLPGRYIKGKLSANEDTIVQLLNNVVKNNSRVRGVLTDVIEDRRTRKTLGTYILIPTDSDGRYRGTYRITGTETGRSSTGKLKPPIRTTKSGHAFQTLTKHGKIGPDIRTQYKVDRGFVFVQIDLSQAEPRIVAVLSNDIPLMKAFESGKVDIHRRTAALVLGYTSILDLREEFVKEADTLEKDGGERFLGKKSRNGGNYDMGPGELALNIATDAKRFDINVSVSQWRASKMLDNFHRACPNIRAVFHKEVQEHINSTRVLINPFGRRRQFFGRLEKKTYGEGYAQIPQSTVADQVKNAMLKSKKEMDDFRHMLIGESHDALLFRFPIGEWQDRIKLVQGHMESPIDFNLCTLSRDVRLKIPADIEVSDTNYRDLKKAKF